MKNFMIVVGAIGALLVSAPAFAQTPPQRAEVPIRATSFARGAPRYSIPITLGGVQFDAMLDTGSYGLRVLSRALPANAYAPTSDRSSYGYGSGAQLEGFITSGQVGIGGLSGTTPFEYVDFAHYGIGGNGVPDAGYAAIVGVGLRKNPDNALNPLPLIGAPTWIVHLPRQGETQGVLVLNPSAADLTGFTMIQLPRQGRSEGWADNLVPACLSNEQTQAHVCLPALIDSGAPGVKIQSAQARASDWPGQSHLTLVFQHQTGGDIALHFASNSGLGTHVETRTPDGQPERLMLGTLPYFAFDVFYDSVHGVIGLKPRA